MCFRYLLYITIFAQEINAYQRYLVNVIANSSTVASYMQAHGFLEEFNLCARRFCEPSKV